MDAFEQVICELLAEEGFWARTSYKVKLTPEEKRRIGRPSCPRWEIDIVGYSPRHNEILAMECKSFLDSGGVSSKDLLSPPADLRNSRYKLFVDANLRNVVFKRLVAQLTEEGLTCPSATTTLGLACGKMHRSGNTQDLCDHFIQNGWLLWTPDIIADRLRKFSTTSYENQISYVVAKMLLRNG